MYGVTTFGGSNGKGVIFSFDPFSSTYTKLKDFNFNDGIHPYGSLVQAKDGKLYGLTSGGGSIIGYGVIFSFDPSSGTYTKLKNFNGANGAKPYGSLIQAGDGKLYGMTSDGGSAGRGNIFSYDLPSSSYNEVKGFGVDNEGDTPYGIEYAQDGYPFGSLMQANDGKLYGMTSAGGSHRVGVIFLMISPPAAIKR